MKEKLSGDEALFMFESMQDKSLLTWYEKWRDSPWLYAMTMLFKKLPFYFLIALVFSFDKIKLFVENPVAYFEQRGIFILILILVFVVLYRVSWNRNAIKYYFLSKINKDFPKVEPDHLIAIKGRKVEETAASKYDKWGDKKIMLQIILGLVLPLVFFSILYISNGISGGNWSLNKFLINGFESKVLIALIFASFMLLGIALGYSLWQQVKDDYLLLNKAKANL